jgi:hypothetical protein
MVDPYGILKIVKERELISMVEATLVNYFDVWGNKKDGWEINNLCTEGIIELPENFDKKDIVKSLKEFGFFKNTVRLNMLDIEDCYPYYEICHKADGYKPICRIEIRE